MSEINITLLILWIKYPAYIWIAVRPVRERYEVYFEFKNKNQSVFIKETIIQLEKVGQTYLSWISFPSWPP